MMAFRPILFVGVCFAPCLLPAARGQEPAKEKPKVLSSFSAVPRNAKGEKVAIGETIASIAFVYEPRRNRRHHVLRLAEEYSKSGF